MENTGVVCDVCKCRHNVESCKCDLPQIKVTEHCSCIELLGVISLLSPG